MWIKICGTTNREDALTAIEAGADALGFVFAPSPRRVNAAQVRQIVQGLPSSVERYGVFVDGSFAEIVETVEECGLTGVQLQCSADATLPLRLRHRFQGYPVRVSILGVLRWHAQENTSAPMPAGSRNDRMSAFERELAQWLPGRAADAVLVDSFSAKAAGGTGIPFDWQAAQGSLRGAGRHLRWIVAGGLSAGNVARAIQTLRPWGVDVVSGVELSPGKKDKARVFAFIRAARAAAADMAAENDPNDPGDRLRKRNPA